MTARERTRERAVALSSARRARRRASARRAPARPTVRAGAHRLRRCVRGRPPEARRSAREAVAAAGCAPTHHGPRENQPKLAAETAMSGVLRAAERSDPETSRQAFRTRNQNGHRDALSQEPRPRSGRGGAAPPRRCRAAAPRRPPGAPPTGARTRRGARIGGERRSGGRERRSGQSGVALGSAGSGARVTGERRSDRPGVAVGDRERRSDRAGAALGSARSGARIGGERRSGDRGASLGSAGSGARIQRERRRDDPGAALGSARVRRCRCGDPVVRCGPR